MTSPLKLAGRGEATLDEHRRDPAHLVAGAELPPEARTNPSAWAATVAVARAIEPLHHLIARVRDRTGVLLTAAGVSVESSDASVVSSAFGLGGPSLVFALPTPRGVPVALALADAWVGGGAASFVAIVGCGAEVTRCLLVGEEGTVLDADRDVAWLLEVS